MELLELRKITDLRQSGENQQFCDDVQYLMDGIGGQSAGLRRACLLDVLRSSCSDDAAGFRVKFRTLGFLERFLQLISADQIYHDPVSIFFILAPERLTNMSLRFPLWVSC